MAATTVTGTERAKGARGGGDEHNERPQRPHAGVAENAAKAGQRCGHNEDPGDQRAGDALGEALAAALPLLGLLDDAHDAGQRVVFGGGGDLDFEGRASVDDGGVDLVARTTLYGHRLAGDGREVEGGAAGADDPVGGDPLAGADEQPVTRAEVPGGDGGRAAVSEHRGLGRDQVEQGPQPVARPDHGVALEGLGDGEQEGQRGGLAQFTQGDRPDGGDGHEGPDAEAPSHEAPGRVGDEGRPSHHERSDEGRRGQCGRLGRGSGHTAEEAEAGERGGPDGVDVAEAGRRGCELPRSAAGVAHLDASITSSGSEPPAVSVRGPSTASTRWRPSSVRA
jgi:hypothetical protein